LSNLLSTATGRFRAVSALEGLSYAVLVFVAMPLKYGLGHPELVRVMGMAHGVLFITFCAALLLAAAERKWPLSRTAALMGWSLIPLGAVRIEHLLAAEAPAEPAHRREPPGSARPR
jgi:integral membrane protein